MGKWAFDNFRSSRLLFEEASDVLAQNTQKLCFEGSESELALTENTQPALLLVSVCVFTALQENFAFHPIAAAGHSVGEYAALVCAKSIQFSDALRAVRRRGQAMQSAVPVGQGGMLAVLNLSDELVKEFCQWAQETSLMTPIEPANYNAPGQVVISGSKKLIEWLLENSKDGFFTARNIRGKLIPLNVSAPFHCSLMKPAEDKMRQVLTEINFKNAEFPIVQNVTALPVKEAATLRENVIRQISAPVQWVQCVKSLMNLGVQNCIELGAGKVLSGLVKKIDSEKLSTFNVQSIEDFKNLEPHLRGHFA